MTINFGLPANSEEMIRRCFAAFTNINEVLIFGSRAMGNYKEGSDIDLAIKGVVSDVELRKIKNQLEEELPLPYFFDIVVYDEIVNPKIKKHIDEFGKVFYARPQINDCGSTST